MDRRGFLKTVVGLIGAVVCGKAAEASPIATPMPPGFVEKLQKCINTTRLPFDIEPKPPGHICPVCCSPDIDITKSRPSHILADCHNCGISFMLVFKGEDSGRSIVFR